MPSTTNFSNYNSGYNSITKPMDKRNERILDMILDKDFSTTSKKGI